MSNIYADIENEKRKKSLGSNEKLDYSIFTGSADISKSFVDVIVTRDKNDYKATIKLHGDTDFMLSAEKDNDIVVVKSMVCELNGWLEDSDYEDIFQLLEELKGLKATLCAYLEDISRMEE